MLGFSPVKQGSRVCPGQVLTSPSVSLILMSLVHCSSVSWTLCTHSLFKFLPVEQGSWVCVGQVPSDLCKHLVGRCYVLNRGHECVLVKCHLTFVSTSLAGATCWTGVMSVCWSSAISTLCSSRWQVLPTEQGSWVCVGQVPSQLCVHLVGRCYLLNRVMSVCWSSATSILCAPCWQVLPVEKESWMCVGQVPPQLCVHLVGRFLHACEVSA